MVNLLASIEQMRYEHTYFLAACYKNLFYIIKVGVERKFCINHALRFAQFALLISLLTRNDINLLFFFGTETVGYEPPGGFD
jgi:hypothetical protein